jgi:plasmid stabilization system protein ParE
MSYVINVFASRDLNDIADYFAENNLEAGDRFFRAFNRKCQQLVAFPKSGKSYETIRLRYSFARVDGVSKRDRPSPPLMLQLLRDRLSWLNSVL